ncbi:hypothetical protein EYF80_029561 [Liparis tanakae]|uniref:Uncharacterized protein n=1 Tax=Liparis tanakae TaxID=230148 RepID=A0A4Z2H343_9TELE|nr:hypothetical protein EYF80_029561 [Liparis tanakae]
MPPSWVYWPTVVSSRNRGTAQVTTNTSRKDPSDNQKHQKHIPVSATRPAPLAPPLPSLVRRCWPDVRWQRFMFPAASHTSSSARAEQQLDVLSSAGGGGLWNKVRTPSPRCSWRAARPERPRSDTTRETLQRDSPQTRGHADGARVAAQDGGDISTVVIGGQAEESGRAVVQDVEGHRRAVTRHQAGDGHHLKRRRRINDETSAQQLTVDLSRTQNGPTGTESTRPTSSSTE